MNADSTSAQPTTSASVSFSDALRVWTKIGFLGFGGPAGQIALMHRELVEKRNWIDEERFLHALNYCTLLPGPEAQQLATYVGWLLHRTRGGIAAGVLFVLPGALAILALSVLYAKFQQVTFVAALFYGLKAAVLAIVIEAVRRIGKRTLKEPLMWWIAALAFVALFVFKVPFPAVIVIAGIAGWFLSPRLNAKAGQHQSTQVPTSELSIIEQMARRGELTHTRPSFSRTLRVITLCLALWLTPLAIFYAVFGRDSVFVNEGLFFSKTAVVTFGGAYAVLAYVAQCAVEVFHWLTPSEMLDGLGLAETTPGPLILVVQFVGFLGAYRFPGALEPWLAGVLGSFITLWVTFVPCFMFIFVGAPYMEQLRANKKLNDALRTITAAVVGVVLNLSVWFALHVLFKEVREVDWGLIHIALPVWISLDLFALVLTALALIAVLRLKWKLGTTLVVFSAAGAIYQWLF